MAVDKTLEVVYDLASINETQATQLITANEQVIRKATSQKKKGKKKGKKIEKDIEKSNKKTDKKLQKEKKAQDKQNQEILNDFTSLQKTANPAAILSQIKSAAPILAPIFIATGLFTDAILKSDEIAKRFVDSADNRINIFVSLQEQALIDNSLQQVIYTTQAGGTFPRDSYNTFNLYDRQVTQDGINTDLNDVGNLD